MAFFDDMAAALDSYPAAAVAIEIYDVQITGDAVNTDETGTFRVRVTNNGDINMNDLGIRITGLNGVQVRNHGAASPLEPEFVATFGFESVPCRGGVAETPGSKYGFKAPGSPLPLKNLVRASLGQWHANLDRILNGSRDLTNAPKAVYAAEVVPA
jgi:hypothetical protein